MRNDSGNAHLHKERGGGGGGQLTLSVPAAADSPVRRREKRLAGPGRWLPAHPGCWRQDRSGRKVTLSTS